MSDEPCKWHGKNQIELFPHLFFITSHAWMEKFESFEDLKYNSEPASFYFDTKPTYKLHSFTIDNEFLNFDKKGLLPKDTFEALCEEICFKTRLKWLAKYKDSLPFSTYACLRRALIYASDTKIQEISFFKENPTNSDVNLPTTPIFIKAKRIQSLKETPFSQLSDGEKEKELRRPILLLPGNPWQKVVLLFFHLFFAPFTTKSQKQTKGHEEGSGFLPQRGV